jgi:1-acyl-sn-glycerol-3-phosphate acyltransferase
MKIIQTLYTVYALILFWFLMILFAPFILFPVVLSKKGGKITFYFIRGWARTWCFLIGLKFRIHGLEHIDKNTPYIFIFNHSSYLDAPAIPMAIHREIKALGKKELASIPIFGFLISHVAIWVDRKNAESKKESLQKLKAVLSDGTSIVVAPEGTRNESTQTLLPFQNGAFKLAIETGLSIMPMAIIGAGKLMNKNSLLIKPGTVHIYFSKAISPQSPLPEEIALLKDKAYNRLEAMILTHE